MNTPKTLPNQLLTGPRTKRRELVSRALVGLAAICSTGLSLACIATAVSLVLAGSAQATIIDFESDGLGNPIVLDPAWYNNPIGERYANLGAHFFNGYFRPCVAMGCPQPAPGTIAAGDGYDSSMTIVFDGVTPFVSADNVSGSAWTMSAFDMSNNFIGTVNSDTFPGGAEIHLPGIHSVYFKPKSQGDVYGIDNLAFQVSDEVPAPIPEPGTWMLLLLGLGGLRAVSRQSRRGTRSLQLCKY